MYVCMYTGGDTMAVEVAGAQAPAVGNRKERRKTAKKEKRKQKRKELAEKEKEEEEARLNDPEERRRAELEEERERERMEREEKEFEEHERLFLEALAEKRKAEEEQIRAREEEMERDRQAGDGDEHENEDDWVYIEDGPSEVIFQGDEIILKKKKVRVKRKDGDQLVKVEDPNRPTSNPFPPESDSLVDSRNEPVVSAQQILDNAAQQIPNFGTEQDKAHCPFHLKTGACRFGLRCSRVHFYPDKSCTLLIKNMYNGPGLAFEQDERLEHTDEEVDRCYEEFYEDVHTEFLKFGEIVNFKVCRNSSFHLRGNLYVHYKSLESSMLAYQSVNGRYFAGKQLSCEFIGVTKWKVAICGEYMKSRLKTCSRGTACNFIHCFRNPGGDYEWADWDKPPPKYWVKEMAALFGYSQSSVYVNRKDTEGRNSIERTTDLDRRHSRRSQSRERSSSRNYRCEEYDILRSRHHGRHPSRNRKSVEYHESKNGVHDSDRDPSNEVRGENRSRSNTRRTKRSLDIQDHHEASICISDSDAYWSDTDREKDVKRDRDRDRDRDSKRDKDTYNKRKRKKSRDEDEISSKTSRDRRHKTHDSDFTEDDWNSKRDKVTYDKTKRKKSKHEDETSSKTSRDRWDKAHDSDSTEEDRDSERDKETESERDKETDTYNKRKRKTSRHEDEISSKTSGDRWHKTHDTDSTEEEPDNERDKETYNKRKRKISRHEDEISSKSSRDRRDKTHDSDSTEEGRDKSHKHSRKSSRHSNGERIY